MSNVHCRPINLRDLCCLELQGFKFKHEGGWAWNIVIREWKAVCGHCKGNTEEPEDFTSQQGANTEEPKDFTSGQEELLKNLRISLLNKGNTEEPEDFTSQQLQYWKTQGFHFSTRAILKNPRISLLNNCNTEEPEDFTSQQGQYWKTQGFHFSTRAITEEPEDFSSGQEQYWRTWGFRFWMKQQVHWIQSQRR